MAEKTIRVVTREGDGTLRTKDYENFDDLQELHEQVGIDDCSTDLTLRGCLLYTSPSPRDQRGSRMPSSA